MHLSVSTDYGIYDLINSHLNGLKGQVEPITGVKIVHHIQLWKMNDNDTHFEAHIDVEDMAVSKTITIQKQIEHKLHDKYEINHTTLQFECGACDEVDLIKNGN